MPIVTDFGFQHRHYRGPQERLSELTVAAPAARDLLGLLRDFVGVSSNPKEKAKRKWAGKGFNLIWRPSSGPPHFFLQLMFTDETLSFIDISGTGIANRGFKQGDIFLGGAAYTQEIKDSFDHSDQHFEPGVWCAVPNTTNPQEPESVVRMGSIPHGTTINLQGTAKTAPDLHMNSHIAAASIVPFGIGSPDDGKTGLAHFDEEKLSSTGVSRTDLARVAALTQDQLTNPNLILTQANAGLTFESIIEISVASDPALLAGPDIGGGTASIAFLEGKGAGNQNADAPIARATFWLQRGRDASGHAFQQLQYTQRVILNFNGLSWPHVTVATLRLAP